MVQVRIQQNGEKRRTPAPKILMDEGKRGGKWENIPLLFLIPYIFITWGGGDFVSVSRYPYLDPSIF